MGRERVYRLSNGLAQIQEDNDMAIVKGVLRVVVLVLALAMGAIAWVIAHDWDLREVRGE